MVGNFEIWKEMAKRNQYIRLSPDAANGQLKLKEWEDLYGNKIS